RTLGLARCSRAGAANGRETGRLEPGGRRDRSSTGRSCLGRLPNGVGSLPVEALSEESKLMSIDPSLIRILTVDDHPLLRKGIAALVNAENDMKLVAEASSGEEAIAQFRAHQPDVTLMDIQLPGLNGIETISEIRKEFPSARIIVLTTYSGDAQVVRAIKAGARGYLLKRQVHRELPETIRAVHAGERRIPQEIA